MMVVLGTIAYAINAQPLQRNLELDGTPVKRCKFDLELRLRRVIRKKCNVLAPVTLIESITYMKKVEQFLASSFRFKPCEEELYSTLEHSPLSVFKMTYIGSVRDFNSGSDQDHEDNISSALDRTHLEDERFE